MEAASSSAARLALVRKHLNRAVATSATDAEYVDETKKIAKVAPSELLHLCVECAALHDTQAILAHGLISAVPNLSSHVEPGSDRNHLLCCLHDALYDVRNATSTRAHALLLFAERMLTGTKPLVSSNDMLEFVILPLFQIVEAETESSSAMCSDKRLPVLVRAALQTLCDGSTMIGIATGRTSMDQQQQKSQEQSPEHNVDYSMQQVGTPQLVSLLAVLLRAFERSNQLLLADVLNELLRCTHATVQLLLPRAASLSDASHAWKGLSWRALLQVWPLIDRVGKQTRQGQGGRRSSAAERLVSWLRQEARPPTRVHELCCLVACAMVPGLPVRQALPLVLSESNGSDGAKALRYEDVAAALAIGLAQGAPAEFDHAVAKLLPALDERGLLPVQRPTPISSAERSKVKIAHALLHALQTHQLIHGQGVGQEEADFQAYHAERVRLSKSFAKWLGQTAQDLSEPLSAAHFLGIALRGMLLCPDEEKSRFGVLRLGLQQRVQVLLKDAHPDDDNVGATKQTSTPNGPGWDALVRELSTGLDDSCDANPNQKTSDAAAVFVPIQSLLLGSAPPNAAK